MEVINVVKHFLEGNEINWKNYTGICTDGTQSMSGQNASTGKKEEPHVMWIHCMLHRQLHLEI